MSKLLRGQQLFISKHITSQISHALSPEPPDPRPSTDFIPCISTYSNGGQLQAVYDLGLTQVGQTSFYYKAHALTTDSFTFPDLQDKFKPSKIDNYPMRYFYFLDQPVKTYAELQRRHKARYHRQTWLRFYNLSHYPFSQWNAKIQIGEPGFSLAGDTTSQTGHQDGFGNWKITYTASFPTPNDPHYTLAHEHPIDTSLQWIDLNGLGYPMFICHRNWLGLHEIIHCHPNIEPI